MFDSDMTWHDNDNVNCHTFAISLPTNEWMSIIMLLFSLALSSMCSARGDMMLIKIGLGRVCQVGPFSKDYTWPELRPKCLHTYTTYTQHTCKPNRKKYTRVEKVLCCVINIWCTNPTPLFMYKCMAEWRKWASKA